MSAPRLLWPTALDDGPDPGHADVIQGDAHAPIQAPALIRRARDIGDSLIRRGVTGAGRVHHLVGAGAGTSGATIAGAGAGAGVEIETAGGTIVEANIAAAVATKVGVKNAHHRTSSSWEACRGRPGMCN